jgi:hypothetical protein
MHTHRQKKFEEQTKADGPHDGSCESQCKAVNYLRPKQIQRSAQETEKPAAAAAAAVTAVRRRPAAVPAAQS